MDSLFITCRANLTRSIVYLNTRVQNYENQLQCGRLARSLQQLREWDPQWADACVKMTTNPWTSGVLSRKLVELISVGINAACTNLNPDGTRRHIRAALEAGATRDEILFVLKCASVMGIHSCSLGVPILLEEAKAAGKQPVPKPTTSSRACDRMKVIGQWNTARDPFFNSTRSGPISSWPLAQGFTGAA